MMGRCQGGSSESLDNNVAMHLSSCLKAVTELLTCLTGGNIHAGCRAASPKCCGELQLACSLPTRGKLSLALFPTACEVLVGCSPASCTSAPVELPDNPFLVYKREVLCAS